MELSQLPMPLSDESNGVLTSVTHSVSRVTLVEEAIILVCITLLAIAVLRRGHSRLYMLLLGFALMPARDLLFWMTIEFGYHPSGMGPAYAATLVSIVGWLLIAGYCATLALTRPSSNGEGGTELFADAGVGSG
jgi:hypothetical protein